jgi:hypothetical protein
MLVSLPPRSGRLLVAGAVLVLLAGAGAAALFFWQRDRTAPRQPRDDDGSSEPIAERVRHFCGGCHAYPPPETFPKAAWKHEVERGYEFFSTATKALRPPPLDDVIRYYVERAPEELPPIAVDKPTTPPRVRFQPVRYPGPPQEEAAAISHLGIVHLTDPKRVSKKGTGPLVPIPKTINHGENRGVLSPFWTPATRPDILACDMRSGLVAIFNPHHPKAGWKVLAKLKNPARATVVDLDGDGALDVLVADLGSFPPTDSRCGRVVWLRGDKQGGFTPVPLLEDVGRVADVQAADFRGVGKLDLVVASFGWNNVGAVYHLENHTEDWSKPKFIAKELDARHGAIHVPVVDLNRDGKPDFVALFGQEHEAVVAFLNLGDGFRKETIFQAGHPAYGSSGIELTDMNGDGRVDVLMSNGDTLDAPHLLKPYHTVQWLENPGDGTFPWQRHEIAQFYGVHRALAADFSGSGRPDVVAVSYLPEGAFPERAAKRLDAILLLESLTPGRFARHTLEEGACDHVSCAVGDVYGTGRQDIVTAVFAQRKTDSVLTVWKNRGPRAD